MKRLYVLRHAKSSWKDGRLADHDRPLSGRGRRNADAMGRHMRDVGAEPELVLCSSSRRTRETLARIDPALGRAAVKVERQLYAAGADAIIARLRRVPERIGSVLVIGHNPGMEDVVVALTGTTPGEKFPTGALATLELEIGDWRALDPGCGRLAAFTRPRALD